jgi:hypothetical protein
MTGPSCDGVPFARLDDGGGDGQDGMHERNLDVTITVGAPLDKQQGGQDPFGVGEVLPRRGAGWLWCAVHGPDSVRSRPGVRAHYTAPGRQLVTSTQHLSETKTIKNRVHLDLTTGADDRDAEIERLLRLGARRVNIDQTGDESWTVLTDPEGNEFCVVRPKSTLIE